MYISARLAILSRITPRRNFDNWRTAECIASDVIARIAALTYRWGRTEYRYLGLSKFVTLVATENEEVVQSTKPFVCLCFRARTLIQLNKFFGATTSWSSLAWLDIFYPRLELNFCLVDQKVHLPGQGLWSNRMVSQCRTFRSGPTWLDISHSPEPSSKYGQTNFWLAQEGNSVGIFFTD